MKNTIIEKTETLKPRRFAANFAFLIIAVLSLFPALLWFTTQPIGAKFADFSSTLTSLGQISGLIGMAMMSLVIILSARPVFMDKLFHGLDNLYKTHRNLGILSFFLLMIHPLVLAASYIPYSANSAAIFLIPGNDRPRDFGIYALLGMMTLVPLAIFAEKLKYQIARFYHRLFGAIFILSAAHTAMVSSDTSRNPAIRWYMLALIALGLTVFTYKTLLGRFLVAKYTYFVKKVELLPNKMIEITMIPAEMPIKYFAGQFVFLNFVNSNIVSESHPFSIASSPDEPEFKFLIKALGDYTAQLSNLSMGSRALVEGPFGNLNYFKVQNKNQLWIAGGSGLAPFLGMARNLKNSDLGFNVDLFCCVGSENELVCDNELARIKPKRGSFRFIPFCSNTRGRIDAEKIKNLSGALEEKDIFLCGPPTMVENLKKQFAQLKISKQQIHSEEFKLL